MARIYRSRTLRSELLEQRRQMKVLGAASKLARSGLSVPEEDVTQVDGSLNVVGDLNVSGAAEITGTLSLPAGIIDNEALAKPVVPQTVWERASGFSVAVPWSTVITKTVTVPDGFTTLDVEASARVTAFYNNPGTGSGVDYLYALLYVGADDSEFYPVAVTDNGGSGTNHVFRNTVLTGLTAGASVTLELQASTGFNTWAGPYLDNVAQLGASLRWTR